MSVDLDALRTLAMQATPGRWTWLPNDSARPGFRFGAEDSLNDAGYAYAARNAEYIAACSPEVVLALVEAVQTLRGIADNEDWRNHPCRDVARAALAPFVRGPAEAPR